MTLHESLYVLDFDDDGDEVEGDNLIKKEKVNYILMNIFQKSTYFLCWKCLSLLPKCCCVS